MIPKMLAIADGRFVKINPDSIARLHSMRDERVRDLITSAFELAVGERLVEQPDRLGLGIALGAGAEKLM